MNKLPLVESSGKPRSNRSSYFWALVLLLLIIIADFLVHGKILIADNSLWKGIFDPWVSLGTLLTAVVIWWEETRQDQRDRLPKRLSVRFEHQGKLLMYCENAHLSGEGDIRALGQQIGAQMTGARNLEYKVPMVRVSVGTPSTDIDGEDYLPYLAVFELTAIPEKLKVELGTDEYMAWLPPFDKTQPIKHT